MKIPGYKVERKIGQGGMAAVYLGMQEAFERKVAIKIVAPKTIADEEFAARFLREAKTVAQLAHSNVVSVYDFGSVEGYHYMSMEYLPGGTLNTLVKSGLELDEALKIIEDVASALHFAHSKGIIHRDVKPENIMFREDHSAVLMDFGIARRQDASDGMTIAGAVMGTPKYMSPEQIQGNDLDGRCDLYSLGIMFYEMLMKEVPYRSEDYMAVAMMHLRNPLPKLSVKFSKAQHFLDRLLAKNVDERFQSGEEVALAAKKLRESGEFESNKKVSTIGAKVGTIGSGANFVRGMVSAPKKNGIKQGIWESEIETKKGFFSNKYQFTARIVSEDFGRFLVVSGTLSDKILEWHQKRKGGCESIALEVSIPATEETKVLTAIRSLKRKGVPFEFLKKLPVTVRFTFIDTLETRTFSV